jgi:hypothetical protein
LSLPHEQHPADKTGNHPSSVIRYGHVAFGTCTQLRQESHGEDADHIAGHGQCLEKGTGEAIIDG